MCESLPAMLRALRTEAPLIHAITNPISINQCANAVLALGARPIMAEHPREVEEITATAAALLLNLGNLTDVRMEAMWRSAGTARELGIPVVLDAVGVACSRLRRALSSPRTPWTGSRDAGRKIPTQQPRAAAGTSSGISPPVNSTPATTTVRKATI